MSLPPTIRVHEVVDDELRAMWRSLAASAGYLSQPEWFDSVLASLPGARARVITRAAGDETTTLIAARIDEVTVPMRIGYRQVVPLRPTTLQVMEGGLLGDLRNSEDLIDAINATAAVAGATVVTLPRLPLDHPLAMAARRAGRPWLRTPEPIGPHHRSDLGPGGYDELMSESKSTRKRVRKYERTLRRDHDVHLEVSTTREELERFLDDAMPIAQTSYQHALGAGLAAPGEADRLRRLAALGWFRGYILRVDGEPWTFDYGIRHGESFTAVATAYRPEHAKKRPGNIALAGWIDDLGADGITEIDWGAGDADYKKSLSSTAVDEQPLVIYRRNPQGTALAVLAALIDGLDRFGRWIIKRAGSAQQVKTWFRRRLRRSEP